MQKLIAVRLNEGAAGKLIQHSFGLVVFSRAQYLHVVLNGLEM